MSVFSETYDFFPVISVIKKSHRARPVILFDGRMENRVEELSPDLQTNAYFCRAEKKKKKKSFGINHYAESPKGPESSRMDASKAVLIFLRLFLMELEKAFIFYRVTQRDERSRRPEAARRLGV